MLDAASHPVQQGSLIAGRFRVESQVSRGGMGTIYRAFDLATGESIALKLHNGTDELALLRFAREAQVLASLQHSHIVRYVAHGATQRGEPFLAMEWLDGEDLTQRMVRAPLTAREAVALTTTLARALAAAHGAGIIHRDLKPGKVRPVEKMGRTFPLASEAFGESLALTRTR